MGNGLNLFSDGTAYYEHVLETVADPARALDRLDREGPARSPAIVTDSF
jgi:hypothetical protein